MKERKREAILLGYLWLSLDYEIQKTNNTFFTMSSASRGQFLNTCHVVDVG